MYFLSAVFVILRSFAYTHASCDSRWSGSALLSTGRRFQTRYFQDGCRSNKQPRYVASNGSYNMCFPKGREGLFNTASCKFYNSKECDRAGQTHDELEQWAATNSGVVIKVSFGTLGGFLGFCILLYFCYRLLKQCEPRRVEPTRSPPPPYTCNCSFQKRATENPSSGVISSAPPPPYAAECICQALAVSPC